MLTTAEEISTTEEMLNCQKSENKSAKKESWPFSEISSLSSANLLIKQSVFSATFDFVCFKVFFNLAILVRAQISITLNWNFNLSRIRFKLFHDVFTQRWSRRTHSTHLRWFFILIQKRKKSEQNKQNIAKKSFFRIVL